MTSHVEVITTDLRRAKVQVHPSMTLSEVLEKAGQLLKLPSQGYVLKHKNKQLDLLSQFRRSGLSSGAKLELIKRSSSPSVVSVALQFSSPEPSVPSGRLTDKFPSDLTLWKVLRQFESGSNSQGRNLNITARGVAQTSDGQTSGSGQLYYETPVLNVLGREFASVSDLSRTLAQVGLTSGSVLLRLSFRKTEQTLYDAMNQISQYLDQTETSSSLTAGEPVPEAVAATPQPLNGTQGQPDTGEEALVPLPDTARSTAEPASSATADQNAKAAPEPSAPSDPLQPVSVFSAPTSSTPAAAAVEIPATDYEPSIAHAQLHQSRLQIDSRNKRLKSDKELAADAAVTAAKMAAVKSIDVRVRFPDNTMAQWRLGPEATGATLFAAVRGVSACATEPFKLVLPGGQGTIVDASDDKHRLIQGYGLKGAMLISLHWADEASSAARSQPFLRQTFASKAQEVKVPVAVDGAEEEPRRQPVKPQRSEAGSGDGAGKKMPKWFKLPGKN